MLFYHICFRFVSSTMLLDHERTRIYEFEKKLFHAQALTLHYQELINTLLICHISDTHQLTIDRHKHVWTLLNYGQLNNIAICCCQWTLRKSLPTNENGWIRSEHWKWDNKSNSQNFAQGARQWCEVFPLSSWGETRDQCWAGMFQSPNQRYMYPKYCEKLETIGSWHTRHLQNHKPVID